MRVCDDFSTRNSCPFRLPVSLYFKIVQIREQFTFFYLQGKTCTQQMLQQCKHTNSEGSASKCCDVEMIIYILIFDSGIAERSTRVLIQNHQVHHLHTMKSPLQHALEDRLSGKMNPSFAYLYTECWHFIKMFSSSYYLHVVFDYIIKTSLLQFQKSVIIIDADLQTRGKLRT